jgi:hypothetical protein
MRTVHDAANRANLKRRLGALEPDTPRRWGTMSVDQMLWHVNTALRAAVGEVPWLAAGEAPRRPPLPKGVLKFLVFNMPWPKGARTLRTFVASDHYDFVTEQTRCLRLVEQLAAKPLDDQWPAHPLLGAMNGVEMSRLQAKHLDHHLKQFGA